MTQEMCIGDNKEAQSVQVPSEKIHRPRDEDIGRPSYIHIIGVGTRACCTEFLSA